MTLTKHFNSKSLLKRLAAVETDTFGDTSLSRHFPAISALMQKQRPEIVRADAPFFPIVHRHGMRGQTFA